MDTPVGGIPITSDAYVEAIAAKCAEKLNGHSQEKHFLGMAVGSWAKMFLGWLAALLVAMATWYLAVRDGLNERPTAPQVENVMQQSLNHHEREAEAHPPIQKRLKVIETDQKIIRESQLRQEWTAKSQDETLQEIKKDIKSIRKNR